jgi:hypothetical protein
MKNFFIFFTLIFSLSVNAENCVGHIFFYNLDEGAGDADTKADYQFYYHKAKKWLPNEGVSSSVHKELPIKSNTCFGNEISIDASSLENSLGYVFIKPNMQQKIVGGVLTDIDISSTITDFLKQAHN